MTSLVAKKDILLATRIEEAIRKNESLESLTVDHVRRDVARARITGKIGMKANSVKLSSQNSRVAVTHQKKNSKVAVKATKASPARSSKPAVQVSKSKKSSSASTSRKGSSVGKKQTGSKKSSSVKSTASKLSVVGFRGRTSWSDKKESLKSS